MFASACVHLSMCRMCGYVCESYVDVCVVFMREYNCEIGCACVCAGMCLYLNVFVLVCVCVVYMSVSERESMRSVCGCQGVQV